MAKRDFLSIVIGTSIKNRDGITIWGDNTVDTPISLKQGLNIISMEFDLNIVAGEYFIDCGMADISVDPRIEQDQRWPFDKISITTSHRTVQGCAFAPAKIKVYD